MTRPSSLSALPPMPAVDPGVVINFSYWPFLNELQRAVGGVVAIGLIILVALTVVAALTWVGGRMAGAGKVQAVGISVFLICGAGAVIMGSASGAIGWFFDRNLGF